MKFATIGKSKTVHVFVETKYPAKVGENGVAEAYTRRDTLCEITTNFTQEKMETGIREFDGVAEEVTCKRCLKNLAKDREDKAIELKVDKVNEKCWEIDSTETGNHIASITNYGGRWWFWKLDPDIFFGDHVDDGGFALTPDLCLSKLKKQIELSGLFAETAVK